MESTHKLTTDYHFTKSKDKKWKCSKLHKRKLVVREEVVGFRPKLLLRKI